MIKCETCAKWFRRRADQQTGQCRALPPTVGDLDLMVFPLTDADAWCASHPQYPDHAARFELDLKASPEVMQFGLPQFANLKLVGLTEEEHLGRENAELKRKLALKIEQIEEAIVEEENSLLVNPVPVRDEGEVANDEAISQDSDTVQAGEVEG